MSIRNTAQAFAAGLIMTMCAFGQFATNATPTSTTTTTNLPPIGIGSTETAEVILTNTAAPPSTTPPSTPPSTGSSVSNPASTTTPTAPSCTGSVSFYNASGTIIGTATPFTLASGAISVASVPYASTASSSVRELIRAVISLTITFPSPAPCALSYSLATFDTATGVTHAMITGTGISEVAPAFFGHF